MKKKLQIIGIAWMWSLSIYAGGLVTNTNQNVAFLRNPAREASMEIDAAYTNPAGLAFLNKDGLFFSLNNQSAFQKRTITVDFAPFAGFGGDAEKKFEGKATAWAVPNLQAAYKIGKWVFSANLGVVGGGGTVDFKSGLPSFESLVAIAPVFLNGALSTTNYGGYTLESQLKGSSITYGAQLGATYRIVEHFSAYAGLRYNYVDNSYKGHVRNVELGMNGGLIPAAAILSSFNGTPAAALLTALIGDKELNFKESGSGVAPIIGLDYHWNGLNIGAKYEFKSSVTLKNKTVVNTTGLKHYDDGETTPYGIPALLAAGVQYDIIPQLTVSASYHHFFDSDAKMANNKQKFIHGGINEYLAGVEYRINDLFLVSCGTQFTRTGITDDYQTDMNFSLNSYSLGIGGAINVTKNIRINLAYFFTNYDDWTKKIADYGNINSLSTVIPATPGTDIFGRTNQSFGIGLDFRF
ncbi:MAG: aromatic hydrocarbon degradation protein [Candidatus Azobacteroides sp.]|nr:aromatic hydrocarbon degradation protein [Candidatus Azobacteroides sp.]